LLQRAGGGIATEYLNHEIMETLTEEERAFLLKTGIFCSVDAKLCKNLIDGFSEDDFSMMVDGLIRKNLFLICLDEKEMVYRYHNILSDYLAKQFDQLPEPQRNRIVQRAAPVFLQRGDVEEALRIYLLVDEYESVLNVARELGDRIEIWSYLDQVPLEMLAGTPWLAASCFLYNIGNLNMDRCRALHEMLLLHRGEPEANRILLFVDPYIKQLDGILPEYLFVEPDVIEQLPVGDVTKAMMLVENATALVESMEYTRAENSIERAIRINANQNIFVSFFSVMSLAQLYEEIGRLEDSLLCYERLLGMIRAPSITPGIAVNYYFGLAGVHLRRMELEKAEKTLDEAETRMERQHLHAAVTDMTAVFHRAEILFLRGEDDAATAAVELILTDYPEFHILTLGRLLQELSCAGKLPDELARRILRELAQADRYREQPFWRMLRARITFANGETEQSIQEVEEVSKFARMKENRLRVIEADLLKIWMISGSSNADDRRESLNLLREAIHDASANRIIMPFYLERRTIVPLLMELSAQASGKHVLPTKDIGLLNELIAICAEPALPKTPSLLSERELEVLRELAAGLTNKEIASKLCVSTATVKTHIINIFGKLGVSSRLMAAQEAQKRGLIS
jgi:LuxR family maltose regulon positive regulatory protein